MRIRWSDWAKIRDRNKLLVKQVIQGPGAETTIVVENPEKPIVITPVQGSWLSFRLARLFEDAFADPGQPKRIELQSGLRVDAILGLDGQVRMQISRQSVWPSEIEWRTTLARLPFSGIHIGAADRFENGGAFYIRASWPYKQ